MMALRFKVPQDVQREDKILWFITLRQLGIILLGGGISYIMFVNITKHYYVNSLQMGLIWTPAAIAAAIAFVRIKSMPLIQFCLSACEIMFFRARYRYWIAGAGTSHTSSTYGFTYRKKARKEEEIVAYKDFNQERIANISSAVDNN